jgi:hypothetical protein
MRRGTNRQLVVGVGKDESLPKEIKEKLTREEPISQRRREKGQTYLPEIQPETSNDPAWLRRYRKATSRERIKVEDEAILDFLTHSRRRRGFIGRNRSIKAAAEPLNRLEQMLNKNLEKKRGRPKLKYKRDKQKISMYLNLDFVKCLEDYSQKTGHLSMQDAMRWILREYLRYSGYPVGQTLAK